MKPGDATDLAKTIEESRSNRDLELLQGTVTSVGTGVISVDFGLGAVDDLRYLGWYTPTVDDVVWALRNGADILVLGTLA